MQAGFNTSPRSGLSPCEIKDSVRRFETRVRKPNCPPPLQNDFRSVLAIFFSRAKLAVFRLAKAILVKASNLLSFLRPLLPRAAESRLRLFPQSRIVVQKISPRPFARSSTYEEIAIVVRRIPQFSPPSFSNALVSDGR